MLEKRKPEASGKSSALPVDYLKMLKEVFTTNFDEGLKELKKTSGTPAEFQAMGQIYPDEILVAVSLLQKDQLAATTAYASCDFDPKASAPTVEDLLGVCVDALGAIYGQLLDPAFPEKIAQLAEHSLSALDDVPFEWTVVPIDKQKVFTKIDKSNPNLESLADQWLKKHDPELKKRQKKEHEETEALFITGKTRPILSEDDDGEGSIH